MTLAHHCHPERICRCSHDDLRRLVDALQAENERLRAAPHPCQDCDGANGKAEMCRWCAVQAWDEERDRLIAVATDKQRKVAALVLVNASLTEERDRYRAALEREYATLARPRAPHQYERGHHASKCAACELRQRIKLALEGGE